MFDIGRELRALRVPIICVVVLDRSRSISIEACGLAEYGCVECVGNASCAPNSCITLRMERVCASLFDAAWLEDASILLYILSAIPATGSYLYGLHL